MAIWGWWPGVRGQQLISASSRYGQALVSFCEALAQLGAERLGVNPIPPPSPTCQTLQVKQGVDSHHFGPVYQLAGSGVQGDSITVRSRADSQAQSRYSVASRISWVIKSPPRFRYDAGNMQPVSLSRRMPLPIAHCTAHALHISSHNIGNDRSGWEVFRSHWFDGIWGRIILQFRM